MIASRQDHRILRHDEGAHRQAVDRRAGDQAHLAHPGERQLQGPRDRCRGQGQDMHAGAQLLQPLLLSDAKMLLLVDNHQGKIAKRDRLGEQRVGADDNIDPAVGQPRFDVGDRARCYQARDLSDVDRQPGKALDEIGVMLARQQGRRHDHRDLMPGHRGHEGRAQRHFGLAEADIAADQPIHRPSRTEIGQRIVDRALLIGGDKIWETGDELFIKAALGEVFFSLSQRPFGGGLQQPVRDFADALLGSCLARLPAGAAEFVELGAGLFRAVTRQQVDIFDRPGRVWRCRRK